MDEAAMKSKIQRAMNEPAAPEGLVRRTIVRANAIEAGRAAENELQALGSAAATEHSRALAARGALGRLMLANAPPDGAGLELLERQLRQLPAFRTLADRPADQVLQDLRSGKFTAQLAKALPKPKAEVRQDRQRAPEKTFTPRLP